MRTYHILDSTDFEDLDRSIIEAQHKRADFDLEEHSLHLVGQESAKATVTYTVTNVKRTYRVGHGSISPADFARDLIAGKFLLEG